MGINGTWTVPQGFGYIKRSFLGSTIGIARSHGQGHVDSVSEAVPLFRLLGSLLRTSQAGYAAQVHAPDEPQATPHSEKTGVSEIVGGLKLSVSGHCP